MSYTVELDVAKREARWQDAWREHKVFEATPKPGQPKFFCTFPYPYVNGLPHVGHLFSIMRTEAFARYKRAQGFNVLFPQGWHATGSPIATAAMRVAENDAKQIQILRDSGIAEHDIAKFKDPEYWIEYFAPRYKAHITAAGLSIDWRREFFTTSLNPHYDAFIRWQFAHLREKGYVQKGRHPVVWCPKENTPVSDHARSVGEGETPQEFTLISFPLASGESLVAATLRPETYYGLTNLWVGAEIKYVHVTVNGKRWIVSEPAVEKLRLQEHEVEVQGHIAGKELIGKMVKTPDGRDIPILPSHFCAPDKGTGLVMSVPSDSPDDWMGLRDLQDPKNAEKEHVALDVVRNIKPIPIVRSSDLGDCAAVTMCERMGIKNQHERAKLEEAKKEVYRKGFYEGVMLAGPHAGAKVEIAKDLVKKELIEQGKASLFYELTGKVVCRCQTPSVVKIVSDQWFITYGNAEWKLQAHEALEQMNLYPAKSRTQFDYVVDWLQDWACTREYGLGTRLPWDERWLIESLSDSTIYMAYYTISHKIKEIAPEHLTREFFDYVFLGLGSEPRIAHVDVKALREEFCYWYPMDFRNSGKDLIQNHLTFMLFNHCAIFPKQHWPRGIGVNGWVTVNGQKMSKSLGNVIPVHKLTDEYGADATRMTILNGGEGMDDPNWDSDFARGVRSKISSLLQMAQQYAHSSSVHACTFDAWLVSAMHRITKLSTEAMELTNFRTAIQLGFFEYTDVLKRYLALTGTSANHALVREALERQVRLIQPFVPHAAEEAWHALGHKQFVSLAPWPDCDEALIDVRAERDAEYLEELIATTRKLTTAKEVREIVLVPAEPWRYEFLVAFRAAFAQVKNPAEIAKRIGEQIPDHADEAKVLVFNIFKNMRLLPSYDRTEDEEFDLLARAAKILNELLHVPVTVSSSELTDVKAKNALPGRPAIVVVSVQ